MKIKINFLKTNINKPNIRLSYYKCLLGIIKDRKFAKVFKKRGIQSFKRIYLYKLSRFNRFVYQKKD